MKAFRFISAISRKGLLLAVGSLVVLASAFSIPTGAVFAASSVPVSYANLTQSYHRDQNWLNVQQTNLDRANSLVTSVQSLISAAQAQGIGTTALSSELDLFQSQISTAGFSHATAAGILAAHNGFDDSGNVTRPVAAAQTVKDATQSLTVAHVLLAQASSDMLRTLNLWQIHNHITPSSPVYSVFVQAHQAALDLFNAVHVEK